MRFEVAEKVVVKDATVKLKEWCDSNLVIDNPEYYKRERMGKWCGNISSVIHLYEKSGSNIVVPFGCVRELMQAFPECGFYSKIHKLDEFNYDSKANLYEYQRSAVESAIKARNGVIVMPCGAGKTQTGLELISRLGGKALWVTHTQDLMHQSMSRAMSIFDCPISSYGTITGGKVNIGAGLTFATVQTLSKIDLPAYRNEWSIIVVDECHKAIGSPTKVMQFYKVLSNLSCRYKFGLTATPKRADGLERSMFALLGDIIYEVSREEVASTTCPVTVQQISTGYMPDLGIALSGDGTINYSGLVDDLTHNSQRFKCVSNTLETLEGAVLVLANRVEYLQHLEKEYRRKSVCLSALGNSKAAKAERKEALRKLNDGEISCVFCTYQLAAEGLDCPNLKYVVFATPEKDPTRIQQASGRVGRKAEGKERGIVIDFIDDFGMYKGWAKKRESVYKKLGYTII